MRFIPMFELILLIGGSREVLLLIRCVRTQSLGIRGGLKRSGLGGGRLVGGPDSVLWSGAGSLEVVRGNHPRLRRLRRSRQAHPRHFTAPQAPSPRALVRLLPPEYRPHPPRGRLGVVTLMTSAPVDASSPPDRTGTVI